MSMRRSGFRIAALALCWCGTTMAAVLPLTQVASLQLPTDAVAQAVDAAAGEARRYAVALDLQADEHSGSWDTLAAGVARWRLRLTSDGAYNLALHLRSLQLPIAGSLQIYNGDLGDVQQPVAAGASASDLLLPLVRGNTLVIEARMPATERGGFHIAIDRAYHGFRSFTPDSAVSAKGYFGDSGSCNIDVACSLADNWRNEIRSVVLLSIRNLYLCSGTLINNSAQDDRALILTAHHCGITSLNVGNTIAYFNVQRSSCSGGTNGAVTQNIHGASVLADTTLASQTDYTLFELATRPPASFKVYYAGWDARSQAPACGAAIHHPMGDDKKISFYAGASAANNVAISNFTVDAWQVSWTRGTTEDGSSGSGLWSENHRVVGTLSGGNGACASGTSTSNNGASDFFARLDLAFNSSGNLKSVLDAANTGCTAINGKNPGSATTAACATDSNGSCGASGDTSTAASAGSGGGGGGAWDASTSLAMLLLGCARRRRSQLPR